MSSNLTCSPGVSKGGNHLSTGVVEGADTGGPAFDALFLAVNTQAEIINALRAAQNATQALSHAVNGADTVSRLYFWK